MLGHRARLSFARVTDTIGYVATDQDGLTAPSTRTVIIEPAAARDVERLWAALTRTPAVDSPDLAALADNPLAPRRGGLLG